MTRLVAALAALALFAPAAAQAEPSGALTVYTSQPSDQMAKAVEAFNADYPDVEVEVFRSGTTEVMNKLQAEFAAGAPQADGSRLASASGCAGSLQGATGWRLGERSIDIVGPSGVLATLGEGGPGTLTGGGVTLVR